MCLTTPSWRGGQQEFFGIESRGRAQRLLSDGRAGRAYLQHSCFENHRETEMNPIQGTKVLITGGAGFVGSTTADQLFNSGAAEVRVLDNFVRGNRRNLALAAAKGKMVVIEGDIRDADLVDAAMDGVDYVF